MIVFQVALGRFRLCPGLWQFLCPSSWCCEGDRLICKTSCKDCDMNHRPDPASNLNEHVHHCFRDVVNPALILTRYFLVSVTAGMSIICSVLLLLPCIRPGLLLGPSPDPPPSSPKSPSMPASVLAVHGVVGHHGYGQLGTILQPGPRACASTSEGRGG